MQEIGQWISGSFLWDHRKEESTFSIYESVIGESSSKIKWLISEASCAILPPYKNGIL
jgi:hypothetical protein